ncbi:MAG: hypothetical protein HZY79_04840 [Rhodoblastus sp.]|nr:MAG: hypothetical protein HZY79_04840 [Rhodoblastus sp.]
MLIPLAALFAAIDRRGPLAPRSVALEAAAGLVVATPIRASAPVPARARARRAGFAVASLDLIGATPETPAELAKRPTAVLAGETLAEGADATLDPAWAYDETPFAAIAAPALGRARVWPGRICRRARFGEAGDSLTPARLLTLAAAGVQTVEVAAPAFRIGGPAQPTRLFLAATLRDLDAVPPRRAKRPISTFASTAAFLRGWRWSRARPPWRSTAGARASRSPDPEAGAGALAILCL